ncbi:MAG: T9SS type A sorting domain-containing protein [Sphingobacteriales bacterium]
MKIYLTIILWIILSPSILPAQPANGNSASAKEITLTIMPNPVKGNKVIVKLEGLLSQLYLIRIMDNSGNPIAEEKFSSPISTNFKMIQLKKNVKGYYRLQLLNENGKVLAQTKFLAVD